MPNNDTATDIAPAFKLKGHDRTTDFCNPIYKRSWTRAELLEVLPETGIEILDIGAGATAVSGRSIDTVTTIDFDAAAGADHCLDFTKHWPFGDEEFDLAYASHVIEHLYPRDRDMLINRIFKSLRPGGMLFVRLPHRSSIQGTGWEHYSLYGTNGLTGLTHGRNPQLPQFDMIATGLWMGGVSDFLRPRPAVRRVVEAVLNRSFRLTDAFLCHLIGGVPEVQFLLRRPEASCDAPAEPIKSE